MYRRIDYKIEKEYEGLRIELYLKRKGYSHQNLVTIKHMPESILVNGKFTYMNQRLSAGDCLTVQINETTCSEKIPPVQLPLSIVYEDEDIIVINKAAGMPIHPSLNNYTNSMAIEIVISYHGTVLMAIRVNIAIGDVNGT